MLELEGRPLERGYRDRADAGRVLARELAGRPDLAGAIVLALPRGGVPVGFEIASALGLVLDVMLVRKLGVPWQPELAMGAVAERGVRVLSPDVLRATGLTPEAIDSIASAEEQELDRRARSYRGGASAPDVSGRTVILVDDGLATGATMRAAIEAVREMGAARVVLAVPVADPDVIAAVARDADDTVCPIRTRDLWAIGQWYADFEQLTDDAVRDYLARAAAARTESES